MWFGSASSASFFVWLVPFTWFPAEGKVKRKRNWENGSWTNEYLLLSSGSFFHRLGDHSFWTKVFTTRRLHLLLLRFIQNTFSFQIQLWVIFCWIFRFSFTPLSSCVDFFFLFCGFILFILFLLFCCFSSFFYSSHFILFHFICTFCLFMWCAHLLFGHHFPLNSLIAELNIECVCVCVRVYSIFE